MKVDASKANVTTSTLHRPLDYVPKSTMELSTILWQQHSQPQNTCGLRESATYHTGCRSIGLSENPPAIWLPAEAHVRITHCLLKPPFELWTVHWPLDCQWTVWCSC